LGDAISFEVITFWQFAFIRLSVSIRLTDSAKIKKDGISLRSTILFDKNQSYPQLK